MSDYIRKREPVVALTRQLVGLAVLLATTSVAPAQTATYSGLNPDDFMRNWLVLGPIPVADEKSPDDAAQKKAFADDLLGSAGGETGVAPRAGAKVKVVGNEFEWRALASANDVIDLKVAKAPEEFSIAYAWAQIDMAEATQALLGVGSDDSVRIWLNGTLIHEHWIGRAPRPDDDIVPVEFKKGSNQLLLKIQNMQG